MPSVAVVFQALNEYKVAGILLEHEMHVAGRLAAAATLCHDDYATFSKVIHLPVGHLARASLMFVTYEGEGVCCTARQAVISPRGWISGPD
jgi:hypothetical protein